MAAFAVLGHVHPFVATGRQSGQQHKRNQGQQDISSGMSHNSNNAGCRHLLYRDMGGTPVRNPIPLAAHSPRLRLFKHSSPKLISSL